ncbi:unnamed protein product [Boreogadus saida]
MLKGDFGRRPATDWPESVTKSRERHGNHADLIFLSSIPLSDLIFLSTIPLSDLIFLSTIPLSDLIFLSSIPLSDLIFLSSIPLSDLIFLSSIPLPLEPGPPPAVTQAAGLRVSDWNPSSAPPTPTTLTQPQNDFQKSSF